MEELKEEIILALKEDFLANIERHRLNIEIMLRSPTALQNHEGFMEGIIEELRKIGDFGSLLAAVEFMESHGKEEEDGGGEKK
jgi:hypothetical protein